MSEARGTNIPNYLTASTPLGLRRLMLLNNKRLGSWHRYDIQWVESKKLWYAWYYSSDPVIDGGLSGTSK